MNTNIKDFDCETEHNALLKKLHQITEGVVVHCDLEMMMERISDDVIGLAIGEEGPYFNQQELRKLFGDSVKNLVGTNRYCGGQTRRDDFELIAFKP